MPRIISKVEGKGNGIKTGNYIETMFIRINLVIPNMSDIAKALGRPPTCKSNF